MLHIVWIILKWILIVVAALLGILVFLLLVLLFCPFCYRGEGSYYGQLAGQAGVTWLAGAVKVTVDSRKGKTIRIFGASLEAYRRLGGSIKDFFSRLFGGKKRKASAGEEGSQEPEEEQPDGFPEQQEPEEEPDEALKWEEELEEEPDSDAEKQQEPDEALEWQQELEEEPGSAQEQQQEPEEKLQESLHSAAESSEAEDKPVSEKEEMEAEEQSMTEKDGEEAAKPSFFFFEWLYSAMEKLFSAIGKLFSLVWRFFVFLFGIPAKILRFFQKIALTIGKIYGNIERWKNFLNDERTKAGLSLAWKEGKRLLKHIAPRKIEGRVKVGFEDPSITGRLTGLAAMCLQLYRNRVSFEPVFEEKVFEGELRFRGHLCLFPFVWAALKLYLDKNIKFMIKTVKKGV